MASGPPPEHQPAAAETRLCACCVMDCWPVRGCGMRRWQDGMGPSEVMAVQLGSGLTLHFPHFMEFSKLPAFLGIWDYCRQFEQYSLLSMEGTSVCWSRSATAPLTKSDRRCYYSLEKVTMICSSTANGPMEGMSVCKNQSGEHPKDLCITLLWAKRELPHIQPETFDLGQTCSPEAPGPEIQRVGNDVDVQCMRAGTVAGAWWRQRPERHRCTDETLMQSYTQAWR